MVKMIYCFLPQHTKFSTWDRGWLIATIKLSDIIGSLLFLFSDCLIDDPQARKALVRCRFNHDLCCVCHHSLCVLLSTKVSCKYHGSLVCYLLLFTRTIAVNLNFGRIALPKGCYLSALNT